LQLRIGHHISAIQVNGVQQFDNSLMRARKEPVVVQKEGGFEMQGR
jgi:hypothetical protein